MNIKQTLEDAELHFEHARYAEAEQLYLYVLLSDTPPKSSVADNWFTSRSWASISTLRTLIAKHPTSIEVRHLAVSTFSKEREPDYVIAEATAAIALLGDDTNAHASFQHQRLKAIVQKRNPSVVELEQLVDDTLCVWKAYATIEKHRIMHAATVKALLRLHDRNGSIAVDRIATAIQATHPDFAAVLQAHAQTLHLFTGPDGCSPKRK